MILKISFASLRHRRLRRLHPTGTARPSPPVASVAAPLPIAEARPSLSRLSPPRAPFPIAPLNSACVAPFLARDPPAMPSLPRRPSDCCAAADSMPLLTPPPPHGVEEGRAAAYDSVDDNRTSSAPWCEGPPPWSKAGDNRGAK
ncbi:hypothetical protein B296_00019802 [Ensete ventricosum]|uniref:Uncharacterized protein n=1 Tax=Ensete ventricosum TaxID=4639 RepID=A0A426ZR88_ENSVE|nr:hypothetical protein B296_00019802 [Ensete ventricosum]